MKKILTLLLLFSQICYAQNILSEVTSFTLVNAETGVAPDFQVNYIC